MGDNFGAGMTGGMAFVWDRDGDFRERLNPETLEVTAIESAHWETRLVGLIRAHIDQTDSPLAKELARNWDRELGRFCQVCPTEMISRLEHPLSDKPAVATA